MPSLHLLVGLPGAGKSTWLIEQRKLGLKGVLLSTDFFIENYAAWQKKTYNEVFKERIKASIDFMMVHLADAIKHDENIIWDQTNLTAKVRANKLRLVPKHYVRNAIIFLTPSEILDIINEERKATGRALPGHILESMKRNFDISTIDKEGFDTVTYIIRE